MFLCLFAFFISDFAFPASKNLKAVDSSQVNVFSYASSNVTTSAYTTLIVSTPITVSNMLVCDSSGQLLKIASGIPGNEVDLFTTEMGGCIVVPYYLVAGQRLAIKAITNTASSGYNVISFLKNNTGN